LARFRAPKGAQATPLWASQGDVLKIFGTFQTGSVLDFSHLSQSRWCRSAPIPQEGPSPAGYDAPAIRSRRRSSQRPGRANPSLLEPEVGWVRDSRSLLGHRVPSSYSYSGSPEEAISAREGVGDFLRVGVGAQHAKSPTGIRGKRREALCQAAKWLKSSCDGVLGVRSWKARG
jgi:hypothetical protein